MRRPLQNRVEEFIADWNSGVKIDDLIEKYNFSCANHFRHWVTKLNLTPRGKNWSKGKKLGPRSCHV